MQAKLSLFLLLGVICQKDSKELPSSNDIVKTIRLDYLWIPVGIT